MAVHGNTHAGKSRAHMVLEYYLLSVWFLRYIKWCWIYRFIAQSKPRTTLVSRSINVTISVLHFSPEAFYLSQNKAMLPLGFIFYPASAESQNVLSSKHRRNVLIYTIIAPGSLDNFFIYRQRKMIQDSFFNMNIETYTGQELTCEE